MKKRVIAERIFADETALSSLILLTSLRLCNGQNTAKITVLHFFTRMLNNQVLHSSKLDSHGVCTECLVMLNVSNHVCGPRNQPNSR